MQTTKMNTRNIGNINILLRAFMILTFINDNVVRATTAKESNNKYEDTSEKFQLGDGSYKTCWHIRDIPNACSTQPIFREKCPYSCNLHCEDTEEIFQSYHPDLDWSTNKQCSMIDNHPEMNLCQKSKRFRKNCPNSCELCPCLDNKGTFQKREGGKMLSCIMAKQNTKKCRFDAFKENCRKTCNTCPITKSYERTCEIDAKVSFPTLDEAQFYGYHSDYVIVQNRGNESKRTEICGHINPVTSWGCTHTGTARIFNLENDKYYDYYEESEYVQIKNAAGGTFDFDLVHYFSEKNEGYYDGDHKMVGTLTIKPTGNRSKQFSHPKNLNTSTHNEDGSVNQDYEGIARVRVQCDEDCKCKVRQRSSKMKRKLQ